MLIGPLKKQSGTSGRAPRGGSRTFALIVFVLGVTAGSAQARVEFQRGVGYPPARRVPLRLFIAPPIDTFDFSAMRDRVLSEKQSYEDFQARIRCVWGPGFTRLARECGSRVTVVSEVLADTCRTGPTGGWLECTENTLGVPRFQVTDSTRLATLRSGGFDLVVVPRSLVVGLSLVSAPPGSGTLPSLETDVAVLDVVNGSVVWSGVVACPAGELRGNSYERLSYGWMADLLDSMHRLDIYAAGERIPFSRKWCP